MYWVIINILLVIIVPKVEMLKLAHHSTLAIVPSCSETIVWRRLTELRTELKDKGLYRWPPHINLNYPFINPSQYDQILPRLEENLVSIEPFRITLSHFGTFGGRSRGVLWLHPEANRVVSEDADAESSSQIFDTLYEKIISSLEAAGVPPSTKPFVPHMTVAHYETLTHATDSLAVLQPSWTPLSFDVSELWVMERRGDDGQFHIAWRLPLLGRTLEDGAAAGKTGCYERIELMPLEEEAWVHEARVGFKKGRGSQRQSSTDSPEEIARKREQRAIKRESQQSAPEAAEAS